MGLSGILDIVQESPTYQGTLATLVGATNGAGPLRITVPDAARSYLIACLCRDLHRTVLLVTPVDDVQARQPHEARSQRMSVAGREACTREACRVA